jgi:hypothetical protein
VWRTTPATFPFLYIIQQQFIVVFGGGRCDGDFFLSSSSSSSFWRVCHADNMSSSWRVRLQRTVVRLFVFGGASRNGLFRRPTVGERERACPLPLFITERRRAGGRVCGNNKKTTQTH